MELVHHRLVDTSSLIPFQGLKYDTSDKYDADPALELDNGCIMCEGKYYLYFENNRFLHLLMSSSFRLVVITQTI